MLECWNLKKKQCNLVWLNVIKSGQHMLPFASWPTSLVSHGSLILTSLCLPHTGISWPCTLISCPLNDTHMSDMYVIWKKGALHHYESTASYKVRSHFCSWHSFLWVQWFSFTAQSQRMINRCGLWFCSCASRSEISHPFKPRSELELGKT